MLPKVYSYEQQASSQCETQLPVFHLILILKDFDDLRIRRLMRSFYYFRIAERGLLTELDSRIVLFNARFNDSSTLLQRLQRPNA